jgi:alcohol dehydrogenase
LRASASDALEQRVRPSRGKMRALRVLPGARATWREVPRPVLTQPYGALVHPLAVASCDLDRPLALGRTPFLLPLHLGHECVAEVLEVGDDVTTVAVGDRVIVPFQISCGHCGPCRHGRTSNCATVPPISMYGFGVGGGHWGGALADELAVPFADAMLVKITADADPMALASVADTASDAYRHIAPHLPALLSEDADCPVLIVGALKRSSAFSASCGLFAGLIATALGARHVQMVDARPNVRAEAASLGFEALTPAELKALPPTRLVVDTSGSARGLLAGLSKTAPDGVCSCAGGLHNTATLPAALAYGRNVTLHVGRSNARQNIAALLKLTEETQLPLASVITATATFDLAPAALQEHCRGDNTKLVWTAT